MEILNWINTPFSEIKNSLLFGKYFDSITMENVEGTNLQFNPTMGIDITLTKALKVKTIHFYGDGHEGVKRFTNELPHNIRFVYSREEIRELLGAPHEIGGGGKSFFGDEPIPFWDKYFFNSYFVHLTYANDLKSISVVSIQSMIAAKN